SCSLERTPTATTRGHPHRAGRVAQPIRREGLGPARVPQSRRFCGIGTRNSRSLRRLRESRKGAERASHAAKKWRKTMAYQAEISRKNPGCFLFLVDQSESMEDPFGG